MKKLIFLCIIILFSCKPPEEKYAIGHIETPLGEMYFWLYKDTKLHKESFIKLAKKHYWDTYSFNRVIKDFVIQGGCPDTPEGFADSPYLIKPEFFPHIQHIYGAVGIGRDNNPEKLSAGCQIYIVHDAAGIPRLDNNYTIFGQIFKGFETLNAIATVPTDSLDAPLKRIPLKVRVLKVSKKELDSLGAASFLENEQSLY